MGDFFLAGNGDPRQGIISKDNKFIIPRPLGESVRYEMDEMITRTHLSRTQILYARKKHLINPTKFKGRWSFSQKDLDYLLKPYPYF